jgi:hypothetical protein
MPENDPAFAKIIAKAWRDPAFKAELIANPAAALKAEGIDLPDGVQVTVVEHSENHFHFMLPPKPAGDLSDEELEAIAGGLGTPPIDGLIPYRDPETVRKMAEFAAWRAANRRP